MHCFFSICCCTTFSSFTCMYAASHLWTNFVRFFLPTVFSSRLSLAVPGPEFEGVHGERGTRTCNEGLGQSPQRGLGSQPLVRGSVNAFCIITTWGNGQFVLTHSPPAVPNCCCSKGSVPYWSNPPFLIFDIWALWRSVLSARAPECQKLKMVA